MFIQTRQRHQVMEISSKTSTPNGLRSFTRSSMSASKHKHIMHKVRYLALAFKLRRSLPDMVNTSPPVDMAGLTKTTIWISGIAHSRTMRCFD